MKSGDTLMGSGRRYEQAEERELNGCHLPVKVSYEGRDAISYGPHKARTLHPNWPKNGGTSPSPPERHCSARVPGPKRPPSPRRTRRLRHDELAPAPPAVMDLASFPFWQISRLFFKAWAPSSYVGLLTDDSFA